VIHFVRHSLHRWKSVLLSKAEVGKPNY